jgi:hypothetical protein
MPVASCYADEWTVRGKAIRLYRSGWRGASAISSGAPRLSTIPRCASSGDEGLLSPRRKRAALELFPRWHVGAEGRLNLVGVFD